MSVFVKKSWFQKNVLGLFRSLGKHVVVGVDGMVSDLNTPRNNQNGRSVANTCEARLCGVARCMCEMP